MYCTALSLRLLSALRRTAGAGIDSRTTGRGLRHRSLVGSSGSPATKAPDDTPRVVAEVDEHRLAFVVGRSGRIALGVDQEHVLHGSSLLSVTACRRTDWRRIDSQARSIRCR